MPYYHPSEISSLKSGIKELEGKFDALGQRASGLYTEAAGSTGRHNTVSTELVVAAHEAHRIAAGLRKALRYLSEIESRKE